MAHMVKDMIQVIINLICIFMALGITFTIHFIHSDAEDFRGRGIVFAPEYFEENPTEFSNSFLIFVSNLMTKKR